MKFVGYGENWYNLGTSAIEDPGYRQMTKQGNVIEQKRSHFKPEDRIAVLEQRRKFKMARSAHAYVRGSTMSFYEWLGTKVGQSVPLGPPIWICGDCHLGNLGPIANAKGLVEIEIRDLDQTVIGNPVHDLIRLWICGARYMVSLIA